MLLLGRLDSKRVKIYRQEIIAQVPNGLLIRHLRQRIKINT